ncbi:MAG TPA: hypothetical protein VF074_14565 [Pyrinomonadaceae bacterium]
MVFRLILTKGSPHKSTHSYTRLWTHLIWETLNREPMLDKRAAAKASAFLLTEYSIERNLHEDQLAFSVSHSDVGRVARYIANQEEHHRKRTYAEEWFVC